MSIYENPEVLASAAHSIYGVDMSYSELTSAGFSLLESYPDTQTGLYAGIWINNVTNEVIVSYRGTDPSAQDAYTDFLYAEPQYNSPVFTQILVELEVLASEVGATSFHFTGHSLGGALAQYGAYRFLEMQIDNPNAPEVTITTFNALGGLAGAEKFIENFDESLIEGITGTHYRIENDGVAFLGEGHLGGEVATIYLDSSLNPFAAHSMSNFTGIDNNAFPPIDFSTAVLEPNTQYLQIADSVMAAQLSSSVTVSLTSDNQTFTDLEAAGRLIVGILPALRYASDEELNQLKQTFLPHIPIDLIAFRNEINNDLSASLSIGNLEQIGFLAMLLGEKMAKEDPTIFPGTNGISEDLKLIAPLLVIWGKNNIHNFDGTVLASLREYLESKSTHILAGALDWLADPLGLNDVADMASGLYGSMEGETLEGLEAISYALYGYGGADTLVGNSQNDSIFADDGNDILRGEGGNDLLSGEVGDDTYYFNYGDGQDTVYDADGNNTIYVQHSSGQTGYSNLNGVELHEVSPFSGIYVQLDPATNQAINNTRYIFNGSALMISIDGGDGGRIIIENFSPSSNTFGLAFAEAPEDPQPIDTERVQILDLLMPNVALGTGDMGASANPFNVMRWHWDSYGASGDLIYSPHVYQSTVVEVENGQLRYDHYASEVRQGGEVVNIEYDGSSRLTYDPAGVRRDNLEYAESSRIFIANSVAMDMMQHTNWDLDTPFNSTPEAIASGADHDDLISGYQGPDHHYGFGGDDYLSGLDGGDYLYGGNGNDIVHGGQGSDYLWSHGNQYSLVGLDGDALVYGFYHEDYTTVDYLYGEEGGDTMLGEHGIDYMFGGVGEDTFFASVGSDVISGGEDNDLIFADSGIWEFNGPDTVGLVANEALEGATYDDLIEGGQGDDLIVGELGNDTILGGEGDDRIEGDRWGLTYYIRQYRNTDTGELIGEFDLNAGLLDPTLHGDDYIDGGAGVDEIWGQGGDDTIFGGSGDDLLFGEVNSADILPLQHHGNDRIFGGEGNDIIQAGGGDDYIDGGVDNDTILGEQGNDEIHGNEGIDTVFGGEGDDSIFGGEGDDANLQGGDGNDLIDGGIGNDGLYGEAGNDILVGGRGVDRLEGGVGDDTYIFYSGDGQSVDNTSDGIIDNQGDSTIQFVGTTVNFVVQNNSHTQIEYGQNDRIVMQNASFSAIKTFVVNGTTYTNTEFFDRLNQRGLLGDPANNTISTGAGNDNVFDGAGNDVLHAGDGADQAYGGEGADDIYAGPGNDIIQGNQGNDHSYGDSGDDIYLYSAYDGNDQITNWGSANEYDVLKFDQSIAVDDVAISRSSNNLYLRIASTGEYVRVNGHFNNDGVADISIDAIEFADGTVWESGTVLNAISQGTDSNDNLVGFNTDDTLSGGLGNDDLAGVGGNDTLSGGEGDDELDGGGGNDLLMGDAGNDRLMGGDGNDVIDGGVGTDNLFGGRGDDTYIFGYGYQNDTIDNRSYNTDPVGQARDIIRFDSSVTPGDLSFYSSNSYLRIYLNNSNDYVSLTRFHDGGNAQVSAVEFADGTIWTLDDLKRASLIGNGEGNILLGFDSDDQIIGLGGRDTLNGAKGNDVIDSGEGDDLVYGGEGNDELLGGAGFDELYGDQGDDLLFGGASDDDLSGGGGNDIYLYQAGDGNDVIQNDDDGTGYDILRFGEGISADDISIEYSSSRSASLDVVVLSTGQNITLQSILENRGESGSAIDAIEFYNGETITLAEMLAPYLSGTIADDRLFGGLGGDELHGLDGDDLIYGGNGNDILLGGDGADTIEGGDGDDVLHGGTGWDVLIGGTGNDTYLFNVGDYYAYLPSTTGDVLSLDSSITPNNVRIVSTDTGFYGNNPTYYLQSEAGADLIGFKLDSGFSIAFADETLWTGTEIKANSVRVQDVDASRYDLTLEDSPYVRLNTNFFRGLELNGDERDNYLIGETDGQNNIDGGPGADIMIGGKWQDVYYVDSADDYVLDIGTSGSLARSNFDGVISTISYALPMDIEYLRLDGDVAYGYGNGLNNAIQSTAPNVILSGGEGDDAYMAIYSADIVEAPGEGEDTFVVIGGVGNFEFFLQDYENIEVLAAAGRGYTLHGTGEDNTLYGYGYDFGQYFWEQSDYTFNFDYPIPANPSVSYGVTLHGGAGDDQLIAGDENDYTNYLYGGDGDDVILGGTSSDHIYGEVGNDELRGGDWTDFYYYSLGDGSDTIIDTHSNGLDRLVFDESIDISSLSFSRDGNNLVINIAGNTITVSSQHSNSQSGIEYVTGFFNGEAVELNREEISALEQQNAVPVANNDTAETDINTAVTLSFAQLLSNDSDADGDSLVITGVANALNGIATLDAVAQTVTFTPEVDYNGPGSFNYTVSDSNGGTALAAVNITVTNGNTAPQAENDAASINEDATLVLAVSDLLMNDSDTDGDNLSLTGVNNAVNGEVVYDPLSGAVIFTPYADYFGPASFDYSVEDGNGGRSTATVLINIINVNDTPVAVIDSASGNEDQDVVLNIADLVRNDSDVDGDSLNITATSNGTNGVAILDGTAGTITFTPDANYSGPASFDYLVDDGNGGTSTATVSLTIAAINDIPVTSDDNITTSEDAAVVLNVADLLANDFDVDSDVLSITGVVNTVNGTAVLDNGAGTITFTPSVNYNGAAGFEYIVSDGNGGNHAATVNIDVSPVNDAPEHIAGLENREATQNEAFSFTVPLDQSFSDADGDPLIYEATLADGQSLPAWLSFDSSTHTFSGTPTGAGDISLRVTASDPSGESAFSDFILSVENTVIVNAAPVAQGDSAQITEDAVLVLNVADILANDSDADGDDLSITDVANAINGTAVFDVTAGTITFTANSNYFGPAGFEYTVEDGNGGSDTDIVSINVISVNDNPVAVADTASGNENENIVLAVSDLIQNDTDSENDALTITEVGNAVNGSATLDEVAGTVTFAPDAGYSGPASFSYTLSDSNGGMDTGTVSLTIVAVNDNPVAGDDVATLQEDETIILTVAELLANDMDSDGNTLTVAGVTGAINGSTVFDAQAGTIMFDPDENFNGSAGFTYTVEDGAGGSDTATVGLTVEPVNDAPVANNDGATIEQNEDIIFNANELLANDSDVDGDSLSIAAVANAINGSVVFDSASSMVTFSPDENYTGPASFDYTVTDGNGGSATATMSIEVEVVDTTLPTLEGDNADNVISGADMDEAIYGYDGNDLLRGYGGNDRLYGGTGDDQIWGGDGDDQLYGGEGNDSFSLEAGNDHVFLEGGGIDTVNSYDLNPDAVDTVVFDATLSEVTGLSRSTNELHVQYGNGHQLTLLNHFSGGYHPLEALEFTDQSVSVSDLLNQNAVFLTEGDDDNMRFHGNENNVIYGLGGNDTILTFEGDDILVGGTGNDSLRGYEGSDTYVFAPGDGQDVVNNYHLDQESLDIVSFTDADYEDLWFSRNGDDLVVTRIGTEDQVAISRWYERSRYELDEFHAGSYVLEDSQVDLLVQAMSAYAVPVGVGNAPSQQARDEIAPVLVEAWQAA